LQLAQLDEPAAGAKSPAAQLPQEVERDWPVALEYIPAMQRVQLADPIAAW